MSCPVNIFNNIHIIASFKEGERLAAASGLLCIEQEPQLSQIAEDAVKKIFLETLQWIITNAKEEAGHGSLNIRKELIPGGKLEQLSQQIDRIRKTFIPKEPANAFDEEIILAKTELIFLQKEAAKKEEKRLLQSLSNCIDAWLEEESLSMQDGVIVSSDDADQRFLEDIQLTIRDGLEWILRAARHQSASDDPDGHRQLLDYGKKYDSWLYAFEGMEEEGMVWVTEDIAEKVGLLRSMQNTLMEDKIRWVENMCPELGGTIKQMMLCRRIATRRNVFGKTWLKDIKKAYSPEVQKGKYSSSNFLVKVCPYEGSCDDYHRRSEDHIKTASLTPPPIGLFAKPHLGEPGRFLSLLGMQERDVEELSLESSVFIPKIELLGFEPGENAIRERIAYKLQQVIGIDFGVPPVVILDTNFPEFNLPDLSLFLEKILDKGIELENPFTCFIQYIPETKPVHESGFDLDPGQSHKPLINTLLLNADGHLDNCLVAKNKLIMIDFGFALPRPGKPENLYSGILQSKNLTMDLDMAKTPMEPAVREKLAAMDISRIMEEVRKDVDIHRARFGDKCALPQECFDMLQLNLLLVQTGARLNVSPREIDSVQNPIRMKSGNQTFIVGGEYLKLYQTFVEGKNEIEWYKVEEALKQILSKPFKERKQEDKTYFINLRLRKIEEQKE